jgi:signal transduction histidine kinase
MDAGTPTAGPGAGGLLTRLLPRYAGNRRLLGYVTAVALGGAALTAFGGGPTGALVTLPFVAWLAFSIAAEFLWLETLSGDCTDSMASTANLSVLFLFGGGLALWIIALSVFFATRFIQKRDWFKTAFGVGQMSITAFLAAWAYRTLHPEPLTFEAIRDPWNLAAMVAAATVYFFVNTWLVAGAVSLERGTPFWETWRKNYAYRNSIVSGLALFALSPLLALSYLTLGYPGVVLFFVPLLIVRNQNREYIHLQRMTQALIATERMAAKGEMAAEVAHEINNYLAVLSGRTQLLLMRAQKAGDDSMKADADVIRQQVVRMSTLAKGLLDFSHKEVNIRLFDLNKLVIDTAEFVRPQNLFDRVDLVTATDPELGEVQADPGQLQQVLLNLVKNAAEAMRDARPPLQPGEAPDPAQKDGRIEIQVSRGAKGAVRVSVIDDGPGMSRQVAGKVFEPGFTSKRDGHGYGLATCYRILQNHGGRIWVESEEGKGAAFHLELPRRQSPAAEKAGGGALDGPSVRAGAA